MERERIKIKIKERERERVRVRVRVCKYAVLRWVVWVCAFGTDVF